MNKPCLTLIRGGMFENKIDGRKELVSVDDLMYLADQYGLPVMIRKGEILVIGVEKTLIFNRVEKNLCQLKELY